MTYELEIYRLNVADAEFERIDIINTFTSLEFFNKLNGISGCKFSMSVLDPKSSQSNLNRYRNHVAVKRNGVVVWFGMITNVSGGYQNVGGNLNVECLSYLAHFKHRFTEKLKTYTAMQQAEIAWELIHTSQSLSNGELLITRGSYPIGAVRNRTYEYANIGDALTNLTKVINGFDFTFEPTLDRNNHVDGVVFNTYYPSLGRKRDDLAKLAIGENIKSVAFRTATSLINTVTAEGSGTGSPPVVTVENAPLQSAYTRIEAIQKYGSVSIPETLTEKANKYIQENSAEGFQIDVVLLSGKDPEFGTYSIGDSLMFDISLESGGGYVDFTGEGRVIEQNVSVDYNGVETITPKLEIIA